MPVGYPRGNFGSSLARLSQHLLIHLRAEVSSLSSDPNSPPVSPSAPIQPAQTAPSSATPIGPSIRPVVSNTTPLITLGEIGLLDALRQLYGVVWIPTTVLAEYQRGLPAHPNRPDLLTLSELRREDPWLELGG